MFIAMWLHLYNRYMCASVWIKLLCDWKVAALASQRSIEEFHANVRTYIFGLTTSNSTELALPDHSDDFFVHLLHLLLILSREHNMISSCRDSFLFNLDSNKIDLCTFVSLYFSIATAILPLSILLLLLLLFFFLLSFRCSQTFSITAGSTIHRTWCKHWARSALLLSCAASFCEYLSDFV